MTLAEVWVCFLSFLHACLCWIAWYSYIAYIYLHILTYTYIYLHIHILTYTYIYLHILTYITYTYIYLHILTYTYIYLHIHILTYTYIYLHILHILTYTYIYLHILTYITYIYPRYNVFFWLLYFVNEQFTSINHTIALKRGRPLDNLALCWSYLLLAVQVHTTTHCRFYREQRWVLHLLSPALTLRSEVTGLEYQCI